MELSFIWLQECPALELLDAMEEQQNGDPDEQMLSWFYERYDYQHAGSRKMAGEGRREKEKGRGE
jgi:hypothetical protein